MLSRSQASAVRAKGIAPAALVLALIALGGCASSQTAQRQPVSTAAAPPTEGADQGHDHQAGMMEMCPMRVPGTTVSVSDTEAGVAVVFRTTGDVAELRRRVRYVAEMHNRHHAEGAMACCRGMTNGGQETGGTPDQGGRGMMMGMSHEGMVPATAAAEDVDGGARIVLTPEDPSQLGALRTHVHDHAERMARGECPMMMMGGAGQPSERQDER